MGFLGKKIEVGSVLEETLGTTAVQKICIGVYKDSGGFEYERWITKIDGKNYLFHEPSLDYARTKDLKRMISLSQDFNVPVIAYFPTDDSILIVDHSTPIAAAETLLAKHIKDVPNAVREFKASISRETIRADIPQGLSPAAEAQTSEGLGAGVQVGG